ncbi:MAG: cob(I)yrinic acid a,c-diamide adenosyltransferase [Candidatus Liptonbacteria bacterium]|nr:cob(I)yrinic acid a,c-diamide adenosyltransferase [Candidatus Liptonbacteria bacterium]
MILVFTGNGKGKTTAALGQAVRALGRGRKVLMIQFIKGPWKSGEDEFAGRFAISDSQFAIKKMGLGFVGILGDQLPKEEHQKAAERALKAFREEFAKDPKKDGWHMIILDEVNVAVSLGLIAKEDVLQAIAHVLEERIVILTGRGAPQEFIDAADLVTEMKEIKHPFTEGKLAKIHVEF